MPFAMGRAVEAVGDVFAYVAIIITIPFVILAVGAPIVLCVRLLLWATGTL